MNSISLGMVVKNEELLLEQCLESVKPVVDEIVIVDTGSRDRTIAIAKKFGARIIRYKWDEDFGRARNEYIKNAAGSWILALDADERIAKKDLPELKRSVKDSKTLGYISPIRSYSTKYDLLKNWYPNNGKYPREERFSGCPGWSLTKRIRLFQRRKGVYYQEGRAAHMDCLESLKKYGGKIKERDIVIHHFQYLKGEKFVANKQKMRLRNEIKYAKTFPNNPGNFLNIGITLFSLKQDNKAVGYLKKAIELNPKFDMAYLVLGMVYKEKAECEKAVLNLKKAISINPKYADAWTVLGMIYDTRHKSPEAEKALKKAIEIHPLHPVARNSLGVVYQNQGRFKKAEKEYRKAIQIHPLHPDAHHNLASLYRAHPGLRGKRID